MGHGTKMTMRDFDFNSIDLDTLTSGFTIVSATQVEIDGKTHMVCQNAGKEFEFTQINLETNSIMSHWFETDGTIPAFDAILLDNKFEYDCTGVGGIFIKPDFKQQGTGYKWVRSGDWMPIPPIWRPAT